MSNPSLSNEEWRRLEELFHRVVSLPESERQARVDSLDGDDRPLRGALRSMLRNEEQGERLERPRWVSPVESPPGAELDRHGQRCGAYRLVREIGRGGMGQVWLAERDDAEFDRQVAIKLLAASRFDEAAVLRFRHERQVLAGLRHANIASLFDGGTREDGQPYLVMEYVDGAPLDVHCRDEGLSLRQRIELFLDVGRAVQHAHRCLVIHRDLKPSNILVAPGGVVKLLDFGIAKVLDREDRELDVTDTLRRRWTPRYASPEQISGVELSTSTDVYALGVVLYELLTERSPYGDRTTSFPALVRAVCEGEVPAPSRQSALLKGASGMLAGDLDAIVLRCLQKDPARRYPSVERLCSDLVAAMEGREISARRPSAWGWLLRRARRQKVATAALALGVVGLLGGSMLAWQQAQGARAAWREESRQRSLAEERSERLEEQRRLAERRAADMQELAHSTVFEVAWGAMRNAPRPVVERILELGIDALERLRAQAGDDPEFLEQLAISYTELSQILAQDGLGTPEQLARAGQAVRTGVELAERSLALDPTRERAVYSAARARMREGSLLLQRAQPEEACEVLGRAAELARRVAVPGSKLGYRTLLGHVLLSRGCVLWALGRRDEATLSLDEAEQWRRSFVAEAPRYRDCKVNLGLLLHRRAEFEAAEGRLESAMRRCDEARTLLEEARELFPEDQRIRLVQLELWLSSCSLAVRADELGVAERFLEQVREDLSRRRESEPDNLFVARLQWMLHVREAELWTQLGDALDAERCLDRALALVESARNPGSEADRAGILVQRAELLREQGLLEEAADDLEQAAGVFEDASGVVSALQGPSLQGFPHYALALGAVARDRARERSSPGGETELRRARDVLRRAAERVEVTHDEAWARRVAERLEEIEELLGVDGR